MHHATMAAEIAKLEAQRKESAALAAEAEARRKDAELRADVADRMKTSDCFKNIGVPARGPLRCPRRRVAAMACGAHESARIAPRSAPYR